MSQSDVLLLGTETEREFNITILDDDCESTVVQFHSMILPCITKLTPFWSLL